MNFNQRLKWRIYSRTLGGAEAARRLGASVGQRCRVLSFNVSAEPFLVTIGDNVTVSSNVTFVTHDGAACLAVDERGRRYDYRPIVIGNSCFIGLGTIILPGAEIGDNCIVAAGSVVRGQIPSDSVVAGVPAKPVGTFQSYVSTRLQQLPSEEDLGNEADYQRRVFKAIRVSRSKREDMST